MQYLASALLGVAMVGWAEAPPSIQYRHLYTFGSKEGIHPPKAMNRRAATTMVGEAEHPYGLAYPTGAVSDNRNRVWIADSGTASVHVFENGGRAYREIRRAGDVGFQQPSGIAVDRANRIYVTDAAAGNVFVFDEHGEYDRALISRRGERLLTAPTAIAVAPNLRTIYVADPARGVIVAFNQEGEVNGTIPLPGTHREPSSIAVVDNDVYVLARRQRSVAIFTASGRPRGELQWDGIRFPSALAHDPYRRRFLVANPEWMTVELFDESGRSMAVFGQPGDGVDQVRRIDALHVDEQGVVCVTDSRNGKVVVFAETSRPPPAAKRSGCSACRQPPEQILDFFEGLLPAVRR